MRSGMAGGTGWNGGGQGLGKDMSSDDASSLDVASTAVTATYSAEDISHLLYILEEEKLAGDVYEVFYEIWGVKVFDNIARSEDSHYSALLKQAENLDLDVDDISLKPAGSYVDPELQALYDSLIEIGSASRTAALEVGVLIEEKDIVDLELAADDVEGTTLESVYDNLLAGSQNHLAAFEGVLIA